jgi:signal peptidase I
VNIQMLKVGDSISFKLPGVKTPVCHRIIEIQTRYGQEYFQTKGDANNAPDLNLVPSDAVNGRVLLHIPYVGRLLDIKNLGTGKIDVLGKSLPTATLVVLGMGILFIGLVFKDTLEDILWPSKKWRRDLVKKQNARLLKRRKAFRMG